MSEHKEKEFNPEWDSLLTTENREFLVGWSSSINFRRLDAMTVKKIVEILVEAFGDSEEKP